MILDSWAIVGTTHVLDSSNLTFNANFGAFGIASATCTQSRLHVDVRSTAALTVTGATFNNCHASGFATGCAITVDATQLPWTVTGVTTSNIAIDGVLIGLTYSTTGSESCVFNGSSTTTWTGRLTAGTWNAAQHEITYTAAQGLFSHVPTIGTVATTISGTLRDTGQTLTLVD